LLDLGKRRDNPSLADYLTVTEAAELLGVTAATLRNWDRAGKLSPRRNPLNGYRLYKREELEAILQEVSGEKKDGAKNGH
jgi:excisionase family DNA binding protein